MIIIEAIAVMLCGIFCFCGGYFSWNFFVNNHKFRNIQRFIGRNGARIFYMILGVLLVVVGLICLFGQFT